MGTADSCIHYQGVYVTDAGTGFSYVACVVPRLGPAGDRQSPFERSAVWFDCDVLSDEEHAYAEAHGADMAAKILEALARLIVAGKLEDQASAGLGQPRKPRRNRRESRERKRLWKAIEAHLRQVGDVPPTQSRDDNAGSGS